MMFFNKYYLYIQVVVITFVELLNYENLKKLKYGQINNNAQAGSIS